MSLSDKFIRLKGRFKRTPDRGPNASTSVSINSQSTSVPQIVVPDTTTPGSNSPAPLDSTPISTPAFSHSAPLAHLATVTLPNTILDQHQPTASTASALSTLNATSPSIPSTSQERSKKPVWAGLKTLMRVIESSTEVFGPLRSAIGELNQGIELFEVCICTNPCSLKIIFCPRIESRKRTRGLR
jgi:hypothetical protein